MKNFSLTQHLLIVLVCLSLWACGDSTMAPEIMVSEPADCTSTLLVADFDSGNDPINLGGHVGKWDNSGIPKVEISYINDLKGSDSTGVVQIQLTNNNGGGPNGWSGGGLVLTLSSNSNPLNLSNCSSLEFDIRMEAGSDLSQTKVKLEDMAGIERPERLISDHGSELSDQWQTVRIPLSNFETKPGDPAHWQSIDITQITKLVTVSVRDANTANGDGKLFIDNVRITQ